MKLSREIKTAILVLSGIALFIYMFTYLKGENIFSKSNVFYTEFNYNALSMSSPVKIKGNTIGKIEDIYYDFETGKTRVEFSVSPKLKFSKNSVVRMYQLGVMSGNALTIIDANDGYIAKSGDLLKSEVKAGLLSTLEKDFSQVSADLDGTIRSADTLMMNLNRLVTDNSEGLKTTISELNTTLKSFKSLSSSIQEVIKENDGKIASVMSNFDKTSENLNELTTKLKKCRIFRHGY